MENNENNLGTNESSLNNDEKKNLPVDIKTDSIDEEVEKLCLWAAARAAVVVVVPGVGTIALIANEVYLIKKIGALHGQELSESIILGFIASLGATVIGSTLTTLIPYSPTKIVVGAGLSYGVGKAAHEWLKAGRPDDMTAFKEVFASAKDQVKENIKKYINHVDKDKPLGDESKEFKL